jgi:hypothetical protein
MKAAIVSTVPHSMPVYRPIGPGFAQFEHQFETSWNRASPRRRAACRADFLGGDRQPQATDDGLFDVGFQRIGCVSYLPCAVARDRRITSHRPPRSLTGDVHVGCQKRDQRTTSSGLASDGHRLEPPLEPPPACARHFRFDRAGATALTSTPFARSRDGARQPSGQLWMRRRRPVRAAASGRSGRHVNDTAPAPHQHAPHHGARSVARRD